MIEMSKPLVIPGTFNLQSETLSCDKIGDDKFACKTTNIGTGVIKDVGIMKRIVLTGSMPNMIGMIGGLADFFIQGDATCTIIDETLYCSPVSPGIP